MERFIGGVGDRFRALATFVAFCIHAQDVKKGCVPSLPEDTQVVGDDLEALSNLARTVQLPREDTPSA